MHTQAQSGESLATRPLDLIDAIMRFESGALLQTEVIPFFQALVDTGMAWRLQGSYGRMAHDMLEAGFIRPKLNG